MAHGCRTHCPRGGHGGGWLHLLVFLALLVAGLKGASYAAPVVSSVAGAVVAAVLAVAAAAAATVGATLAVQAVLNRRALARFAALEQEARPEQQAPAALAGGARELEASPVVRAEAFRVESLRDAA